MISERIKNILNEQINKEFYSAYLYLAMSAFFDEIGLHGFSNWTKVQAREEVDHGMIIFDYLIERNTKVELLGINLPDTEFTSPTQVFEKILHHEIQVTEQINKVAIESDKECDLATRNFINWYITEQVEEEAIVRGVLSKLKMFGEEKSSLYLLDKEFAERKYKSHTYN